MLCPCIRLRLSGNGTFVFFHNSRSWWSQDLDTERWRTVSLYRGAPEGNEAAVPGGKRLPFMSSLYFVKNIFVTRRRHLHAERPVCKQFTTISLFVFAFLPSNLVSLFSLIYKTISTMFCYNELVSLYKLLEAVHTDLFQYWSTIIISSLRVA